MPNIQLFISDLAQSSEHIIQEGLSNPGPITLLIVFTAGLLTSLGPCSLSLLPVTIAFLAGFKDQLNPFQRSFSFCSGIVGSLLFLGSLSNLLGRIYGQVPNIIPIFVGSLAVVMGLNLLGFLRLPLPQGPDPKNWGQAVPPSFAPFSAGLAFGLASSPCTTPVLAVLLGWIAQTKNPAIGCLLLICFGFGQVIPLFIAGSAAATIPNLLALRPIAQWIPAISGVVLFTVGMLTLLAKWI